jgi:hypothetical protein
LVVVKAVKTLRLMLVLVVQAVVVRLVQLQILALLHKPHNLALQVMETLAAMRLTHHIVLAVVAALEVLVDLETMELLFQATAERAFNSRPVQLITMLEEAVVVVGVMSQLEALVDWVAVAQVQL